MAGIDEASVRQRLDAERERLEHEIYALTQGDRAVRADDSYLDAGGLKTEQADDAELVFEAQRNQGVADNAQILLRQVRAAMERLEHGTYGICANCGKEINPKRLERLPYATLCIDCQAAQDARSGR